MRSLSVIIPAFNEAANIVATLDNVTAALSSLPIAGEIIVIDDGSGDETSALALAYARRSRLVSLLSNGENLGFGASYRRGVAAATLEHIVMIHGDNAWSADTLRPFFARTGAADVVIGYTRNMWRARPLGRTLLSKAFTLSANVVTGRHLTYYNGLQIHRADVLKEMAIESSGFGFQAEVLVKGLAITRTFIEVPLDLTEREHGDSKAFALKNVADAAMTLRRLRAIGATGVK